jgi:uncharacterized protein (TIGR03083 family)
LRFASKKAFLEDIQFEYRRLEELLADLDAAQMTQFPVCARWTVKDILAHLHEWHCMALRWYEVGLTGRRDAIPAAKDIPPLNKRIYEKHKDRPLPQVLEAFRESHRKMLALVEALSEEQLLTPGYFAWTRTNPLTTYLSPNLGSHYRWAIRHIRRWRRTARAK